jgi:hypothetical protein
MKNAAVLLVSTCVLISCGCNSPVRTTDARCGFEGRVLSIWPAPLTGWQYGAEGQLFPPSWPAYAFVLQEVPEYDGPLPDTVLVFACGPDLRKDDPACRLLAHARYLRPCLGEPRGMWGRFDRGPYREPCFLFVDETGGTAGSEVLLFEQGVVYGYPEGKDRFQDYGVGLVFEGASRHGIYVGDVDGEGHPELVIPRPECNATGVPEHLVFDVFVVTDGEPAKLEQLTVEEVEAKEKEGILQSLNE